MAGFGDLPVGQGGSFPAPKLLTPAALPTKGSHGLLGAIYNHLLAPTVNSVSGAVSDIPKIGSSIGYLGKVAAGELTGNQKAVHNANERQNQLLQSTNFHKNFEDQNVEKALGKTGNQVLNITAPVAGAGNFAGKAGLKALAGAGAKTGFQYGGAGGVSNALAQGGNGEDIFASGLEGGILGAGAGLAGGTLGAGLGRLARKAPAISAAPGKGLLSKSATRAGERAAQAVKAQEATDFVGATPNDIKATLGRDKQGNNIGLNEVSDYLRGLSMPAHAVNMQAAHDFMTGTVGGHLADLTDGVRVKVGSPADVGRTAITDKIGLPTKTGATGSASDVALRNIRQATLHLGIGKPTAGDVLGSVRQLEQAQNTLRPAISAGDTKAIATRDAYQSVIDHLNKALGSSEVNNAVKNFSVSPELRAQIQQEALDAGVSPQMGKHVIDTLDNAKSYTDLRSSMQPAVVAGKLAQVARDTFSSAVPKATKGGSIPVPSWELAMSLHNPSYAAAAAARVGEHTNILDKLMGKVNPSAFNTGQEAGLAPAPSIAGKLANPGGISGEDVLAQAGRPPHQAALEAASNAGDMAQVRQIIDSIPMDDPYKQSMENLFEPELRQQGVSAEPTRISFPQTTSGEAPVPITSVTQKPLPTPIDLRREMPGPIAKEPGSRPIDLRTGPEAKVRTVRRRTGVPPTPSALLEGLTTPGHEASPSVLGVPVQGTSATTAIPTTVVTPDYLIKHGLPPELSQRIAETLGNIEGRATAVAHAIPSIGPNLRKAGSDVGQKIASAGQRPELAGAITGMEANAIGQGRTAPVDVTAPLSASEVGTNVPDVATTAAKDDTAGDNSVYGIQNLSADLARDPRNATTYITLFKTLNPNYGQAPTSNIGKPTAIQAANAQSGLSSLGQLQALIKQDPNLVQKASLPGQELPLVGGLLSRLYGTGEYQALATNALDALARERTGAAMTKSEELEYKRLLPQAGNTPEDVQTKLAQIQQLFESLSGGQ